jgi:hypothetical protein
MTKKERQRYQIPPRQQHLRSYDGLTPQEAKEKAKRDYARRLKREQHLWDNEPPMQQDAQARAANAEQACAAANAAHVQDPRFPPATDFASMCYGRQRALPAAALPAAATARDGARKAKEKAKRDAARRIIREQHTRDIRFVPGFWTKKIEQ